MFCEPLRGRRRVEVTDRRTKVDWARQIQTLVEADYPDADRITLMMDNLNTHAMASLYEAFRPTEVRRLMERLEPVYTLKHGSWLDIAEIELNVLVGSAWIAGLRTKRRWSGGLARGSATGTPPGNR